MTDLNPAAGDASPVHALIQQREQLRTWISKLDEVATGAPTRVAERIRQDYGDRLARVTAELGAHREEIGRSLESMRASLGEAEERHTHATESLEEMRLRHLIGELPEDEWETQRVRLEREVESVRAQTERVRAEVERLALLASDVAAEPEPTVQAAFESAAEEPAAAEPAAPEADAEDEPIAFLDTSVPETATPAAEEALEDTSSWLSDISLDEPTAPGADATPAAPGGETPSAGWDPFGNEMGGDTETPRPDSADLPWLETPARADEAWSTSSEGDGLEFLNDLGTPTPGTPAPGADLAEDDLAFLEELDRAISGSPGASRPATPPPPSPPAANSAPKAGASGGPLLCKECGAINEPHSWYCEICGSEL